MAGVSSVSPVMASLCAYSSITVMELLLLGTLWTAEVTGVVALFVV